MKYGVVYVNEHGHLLTHSKDTYDNEDEAIDLKIALQKLHMTRQYFVVDIPNVCPVCRQKLEQS